MHLTREALDLWAADRLARPHPEPGHRALIRLEEGDSMVVFPSEHSLVIDGPAIVELVVYRDGGWSARELTYETPESIALAASLAQRTAPNGRALCNYGHTMAEHKAAGACVRPGTLCMCGPCLESRRAEQRGSERARRAAFWAEPGEEDRWGKL